jgi:phosphatidylinositol alpha-mannosyltransferase
VIVLIVQRIYTRRRHEIAFATVSGLRIALTHAYSWPEVRRGGERLLHEVAVTLAGRGHDVTVFTSGDQPGVTNEEGVRMVRHKRRLDAAAEHEADFSRWLFRRLVSARFDIVHSYGPIDAVASIRASRLHRGGRRTVFTNLGNPKRVWWDALPEAPQHQRIVDQVDVYGCLSQFGVETLQRDYGRVGVITSGGVRLDLFRPAEARTDKPTVLFSGALQEPRKGLDVLVRAVEQARGVEPDLQLWVTGPGDPSQFLATVPDRIREAVEVLPLGTGNGITAFYARAWVTALPASEEAFGLVLAESLTAGTPVVAGNSAGLPELVTPGRTGAICEPGDVASVAAAIAQALALSRQPGIADSCRDSVKRFDWESGVVPALEQTYHDALARPPFTARMPAEVAR